ncbi:hypothetical protein [Salibacterium qingdaonense]|uniref:Uncharacterized protein n=1 Tax=Salibacterium qingdaonense TaxID=266892 RepID=A0A1I4LVK7_9BACI|nr:hypothetical protein [Salibacterium qingdaonense]SFL95041.1 hypothetical protein SAMN04488054_10920 [Salibacterium qingdaonense]
MLIVLDETIGFSSLPFQAENDISYVIKPAKTKKQNQMFEEYEKDQSSTVFSKNLRFSPYSMEDKNGWEMRYQKLPRISVRK